MKTAIYIEDGLTQFVLTAESDIDKKILSALQNSDLKTYRGSFYECQGGYMRHDHSFGIELNMFPGRIQHSHDDDSLIMVLRPGADVVEKKPEPRKAETIRLDGPGPASPCIHHPMGGKEPCDVCHPPRVIDGTAQTCSDCASAMFGQCDRHRVGGTGF